MNPGLVLCAAALVILSGCSGSDSQINAHKVVLSSAPSVGASSFIVSGDPAGSFGEALVGADGKGVMLIASDDTQPAAVYYEITKDAVRRVPAAESPLEISMLSGSTTAVNTGSISLAGLAGSYSTLGKDNAVADFSISDTGEISAGGSACKVSGSIQANAGTGNALPLTVNLGGCGTADGAYQGYAVKAAEYAPASLRLIGENQVAVVDMLAFK